jgi:hypothetical protein
MYVFNINMNFWLTHYTRSNPELRNFDRKNHMPQRIARKDHVRNKLPKRTTSLWRQNVPGNTWHLPPVIVAAEPAAALHGGTLGGKTAPLARR